jgi:hypothetical protein
VLDLAFELKEQASGPCRHGRAQPDDQRDHRAAPPVGVNGKFGRVFFVSQVKTNPPTIVMIVNRTEVFAGSYERYLMNRLREELPFGEVPIRLIFRSRKRAELAMLKAGKVKSAHERGQGRPAARDRRRLRPRASGAGTDDIEQWLRDLPDDPEALLRRAAD